jgi:hypothetical protein
MSKARIALAAASVLLLVFTAAMAPSQAMSNYKRFMAGEIRLEQLSPKEAMEVVRISREQARSRNAALQVESCREQARSRAERAECDRRKR